MKDDQDQQPDEKDPNDVPYLLPTKDEKPKPQEDPEKPKEPEVK